uniref:Gag/pol protein n=1 Tax=Cannabis sativa TaxID=3483 RepID=A0A803QQ23_CANSA
MNNTKGAVMPSRHGVRLCKEQCPIDPQKIEDMRRFPYASTVGSLMYAMLCTRPNIYYVAGIVSRSQSNPGKEYWTTVKHILKYLKRTKDNVLVYKSGALNPLGYTNLDFQAFLDDRKSTPRMIFTLAGGAVDWKMSSNSQYLTLPWRSNT